MDRIAIHICSKDRATEVALLLESLRNQTYKKFDVYILDDGSSVPLQHFYFITYIMNRLKIEGHDIKLIRNNTASGVSKARQQLVDYTMKNTKHNFICRIDDDSICKLDMLEKLMNGIDAGYDLIGCSVFPYVGGHTKREISFVKPIIGECRLNDKGELIINQDDCGYEYIEEEILPTHHFRSSCLYKRELHEAGVDYSNRLSKNGFREEQIFSFKAILKGFKLGVHTGAINYHLITPSGGERGTMNMTKFNQDVFEETVKKMYADHGDFLHDYNVKHNLIEKEYTALELTKITNLVSKQ